MTIENYRALLTAPPRDARGFTRWWWYGCCVEKEEIDRELDFMRENIALHLKVPKDRISVKATTEERLGFTGSGEGIAAQAVCAIAPLSGR